MFDSPWPTTEDQDATTAANDDVKNRKLPVSSVKVYDLGDDNGKMITYVRNGALEVHHQDNSGISGVLHLGRNKPNPRFVGTMMRHLLKHGLEKSHPVRIIAKQKLFVRYKSLIDKLLNQKLYRVVYSEETVDGQVVETATIYPRNKISEEYFPKF
jgi:hypothetical protein